MPDLSQLDSAEKISAAGEEIYGRLHQKRLEAECPGQFVAVDVSTEQAYVAELSVDALQRARESAPTGVFHLIRIGSPTAFQKGYMSSPNRKGIKTEHGLSHPDGHADTRRPRRL